jgi:hypothetical protein
VQHDAADVLAGAQPHVGPGLAGVGGLVDAVAPADALPVGAFAGADPDDVGLGWKMAMSPTECTGSRSNTGSQVMPLSVVRNTPPVEEATYMVYGSDSTTSMSTTRPDMVAGPMLRRRRPARSADCSALDDAEARDRERASGQVRGPLHGIPVALKDNIHTTICRPRAARSPSTASFRRMKRR